MPLFANRLEAARELADALLFLRENDAAPLLVLGIPNGGVPIASHVAGALEAPLDILLISRLRASGQSDEIVGAVDEHGRIATVHAKHQRRHTVQSLIPAARHAFADIQHRRARYRRTLSEMDVRDRTVLIVDDGVATGATMLGAISSVRDRGAQRIIAAAPAGAGGVTWQLHEAADLVVIPHTPSRFKGVAHFYGDRDPVRDELVDAILSQAAARRGAAPGVRTVVIRIPLEGDRFLHCELDLPPDACRHGGPYPAVIFAHGFESDSHSPRSVPVSRRLAKRGVIGVRLDFTGHGRSWGTLDDADEHRMVQDLTAVHDHLAQLAEIDATRIAVNGSGGGGLIALRFAAEHRELRALVIRGPICGDQFTVARRVAAPTLLIHAENDTILRDGVEKIDHALQTQHELLVIPDSSRLFSDPISRELMMSASIEWLVDHLKPAPCGRRAKDPPVISTERADVDQETPTS